MCIPGGMYLAPGAHTKSINMKTKILLLALASVLLATTSVSAQKIHIGFKGGAALSINFPVNHSKTNSHLVITWWIRRDRPR